MKDKIDFKCCCLDGMQEVTKSKCLEKKAVSKKCIKCKSYRNKVRFNTLTSNITIQSKCIVLYQFQWTEYPNTLRDLPAVPKLWHLVPRLGLHLNMEQNIELDTTNYQVMQFWFTHNQLVQACELGYHLIFPLPSIALTCFKFTHGTPVTRWFPISNARNAYWT